MPVTCLIPEVVNTLKKAAGSGAIDIAAMFNMSSSQRRNLFKKYVDDETAIFLNTGFEKAMVSARKDALKDWVKKTFNHKDPRKNDISDRLEEMEKKGLVSTKGQVSFLEDAIADSLGVRVTETELQIIIDKSNKLENLASARNSIGTPTIDYFRARRDMADYIDSITPSENLRVATSVIARSNLLLSPKSALTNIIGNIGNTFNEFARRRINDGMTRGLNNSASKEYIKEAVKIFHETGYDVTRMMNISDDVIRLGEKITTSQGPGVVRAVGRFYEDIVFKKMLGTPDVLFAAMHFADSADIASTKIARERGLYGDKAKDEALKMFKDAMKIDPDTDEGKVIRENAVKDAMIGTYTDDNTFSQLSLGARDWINNLPGMKNVRLGDLLVPFAKTPANVILRTIESSGATMPFEILKLIKARKNNNPVAAREALAAMGRSGLGVVGALVFAGLFDVDDYVGEYGFTSQKERELIKASGATYNSLKIGSRWISLDYFGPFAGTLVGFLNARKYGKSIPDMAFKYYTGVLQQITRVPGFDELTRTIKGISDYVNPRSEAKKSANDAVVGAMDFVAARVIPSIVSDLAKMTDEFERDVKHGTIEGALEKIQRRIPVLSQSLEPKMDFMGNPIKTQNPFATLAFGARYKKGKEYDIVNELNRLNAGGELPNITDIRRSSSRVKKLRDRIGPIKTNQMFRVFGKRFQVDAKALLIDPKYISASDEGKKKMWNKVKSDALYDALKAYSVFLKK